MPDEKSDSKSDSGQPGELAERALDLVLGLWSGQLVHAAVELGILDRLAEGSTTADDVAEELALDPDATYRLLRALGYYDVVVERPERQFSLEPIGECFLADHPHSLRGYLRFLRSPEFVSAMLHLPDVVREGGPNGFVREYGSGLYEYAEDNPTFGAAVDAFMTAKTRRLADGVLDALDSADVGEYTHVCDVGGGAGISSPDCSTFIRTSRGRYSTCPAWSPRRTVTRRRGWGWTTGARTSPATCSRTSRPPTPTS